MYFDLNLYTFIYFFYTTGISNSHISNSCLWILELFQQWIAKNQKIEVVWTIVKERYDSYSEKAWTNRFQRKISKVHYALLTHDLPRENSIILEGAKATTTKICFRVSIPILLTIMISMKLLRSSFLNKVRKFASTNSQIWDREVRELKTVFWFRQEFLQGNYSNTNPNSKKC